jgi:hypothetical protein
MLRYFIFIGLILVNFACNYLNFKQKDDTDNKVLAKVHGKYLYLKEVKHLLNNADAQDSANILQRYIDTWVKRQLLFYEADEKAEIDREELERRTEEYRYQLLMYAYQKQYIEANLDTVVTSEQIQKYYTENIQNFELKQHIVRCIYAKFPKDAPKKEEMQAKIATDNADDIEDFKSYCYIYAKEKNIKDSIWLPFEQAIAYTPFAGIENAIQFLKNTKNSVQEDDNFWYVLRILDYKMADQVSPVAYVKEQIVATILNQRKIILQQQHEEGILAKARKTEDYEIFYPK